MKPKPTPIDTHNVRHTVVSLAGAALSACLIAAIGLAASSAAEPAAVHNDADSHAMSQHGSDHLQRHLDKLAERLEIKASQEAAWQKYAAAFRTTMLERMAMAYAGMASAEPGSAPPDAASMARQHADRAAEQAKTLAQLADATAALEQSLNPNQRLVLDEAARHFATEHGAHHGMGAMAEDGIHDRMGGHCERYGAHGYPQHWESGEPDEAPHGTETEPPEHALPGDAAH